METENYSVVQWKACTGIRSKNVGSRCLADIEISVREDYIKT